VGIGLLVACSPPADEETISQDIAPETAESEELPDESVSDEEYVKVYPEEYDAYIVGNSVNQYRLEIKPGDVVNWISNIGHDCMLVFESGEEMGYLPDQETLSYSFTEEGEYHYYCQENDMISGIVIVE